MVSKNTILVLSLFSVFYLRAQQAVLPFELYKNKHVLVKLPVEGKNDSIVYYFDTGVTSAMIDKNFAEKIGLKANNKKDVEGTGGVKTYETVTDQNLKINDKQSIKVAKFILNDFSALSTQLGSHFEGLIGNDILKNYITQIDFDKKEISLYNFNDVVDYTGYTEIPFQFKKGIAIPQFEAVIELQNGEKFSGDVFFDSGAGLTLLVNAPFAQKNKLAEKFDKIIWTSGTGLNSNALNTTSLVKSINIGNYNFKDIPVSLSNDKTGVSSFEGYMGILGAEIINRFNVILDYSRLKLYLKPNHLYKNSFDVNQTCIPFGLTKTDKGITLYYVIKKSEAYKKGLRKDQKIVSINGKHFDNIQDYQNVLNKDNKKITIEYLDENNQVKKIKFKRNALK